MSVVMQVIQIKREQQVSGRKQPAKSERREAWVLKCNNM